MVKGLEVYAGFEEENNNLTNQKEADLRMLSKPQLAIWNHFQDAREVHRRRALLWRSYNYVKEVAQAKD